jgi:hypothetical protein
MKTTCFGFIVAFNAPAARKWRMMRKRSHWLRQAQADSRRTMREVSECILEDPLAKWPGAMWPNADGLQHVSPLPKVIGRKDKP